MSRINESCHDVTYEWVVSHMKESCHIWMSHITYEINVTNQGDCVMNRYVTWHFMSRMNDNVDMWLIGNEKVTSLLCMKYVTHMNESCHILKNKYRWVWADAIWGTSKVREWCGVPPRCSCCRSWCVLEKKDAFINVWHDSFLYVIWLIIRTNMGTLRMSHVTHFCVTLLILLYVTWLLCDMTHFCMWHDSSFVHRGKYQGDVVFRLDTHAIEGDAYKWVMSQVKLSHVTRN